MIITIVVYTGLRARSTGRSLGISLLLVGLGLVAFSVSDSGFVYLTTAARYSSGSPNDVGWFAGFALLLLAAVRPAGGSTAEDEDASPSGRWATCCPTRRSASPC